MKDKVIKKPVISVVGGIEQGKTSLIESLWEGVSADKSTNGVLSYSIREDIPGRGEMDYQVKELDSVVYSLQKNWFKKESNLEELALSDVILFLVPASSFGYKQEIAFLRELVKSQYYHNQHIVICLSKADYLIIDDDCKNIKLESITRLMQINNTLFEAFEKHLKRECFSCDSIIPVSVPLKWNYDVLKEKLWEGIIERVNETTFDNNAATVVIAGKRGCGKSTTLNELWGLDLPTNKAVACTKYPMVLRVPMMIGNSTVFINLVDLPGIAESLDADMQYTAFYEKYIDKASVLICLSQADTRAYKQDELFYNSLMESKILTKDTQLILGINQIDLLFKTKETPDGINLNMTSVDDPLIQGKIDDYYGNVYSKIFAHMPNVSRADVCAYSALFRWNINSLKRMLQNKLMLTIKSNQLCQLQIYSDLEERKQKSIWL